MKLISKRKTVYLQGNTALKYHLKLAGVVRTLGSWYKNVIVTFRPSQLEVTIVSENNCFTVVSLYRAFDLEELRGVYSRVRKQNMNVIVRSEKTIVMERLRVVGVRDPSNPMGGPLGWFGTL